MIQLFICASSKGLQRLGKATYMWSIMHYKGTSKNSWKTAFYKKLQHGSQKFLAQR